MGDLVELPNSSPAPVDKLRQELVEAKQARSLPRLQRVIGAATVAADAQHRVARLAEGEGSPREVVEAANVAANDAATVRLEAQAAAGHLLQEMQADGRLEKPGGDHRSAKTKESSQGRVSLGELLGTKTRQAAWQQSFRWQKVAGIPEDTRQQYVDETKEKGDEITTAGLLRYVTVPKERAETDTDLTIKQSFAEAIKLMQKLTTYKATAIAAYASESRNKTKFRQEVDKLDVWLERVRDILK